jgi:hypothetical protein
MAPGTYIINIFTKVVNSLLLHTFSNIMNYEALFKILLIEHFTTGRRENNIMNPVYLSPNFNNYQHIIIFKLCTYLP